MRGLGKPDFFRLMKENDNREKVMEEVDKIRSKSVYTHSDVLMLAKHVVRTVLAASDFQQPVLNPLFLYPTMAYYCLIFIAQV